MKLIVIRHGETIENSSGIIQGQRHGKLSKKGIGQAEKLGEELKNTKIDFMYSSDLGRTKETIERVLKYHPDVPVIYDPLIRERHYGEFEGKKKVDVVKSLGRKARIAIFKPEGGENTVQFRERVEKFLVYLNQNHQANETILICTHGGWKQALYRVIKGITHTDKIEGVDFSNASISEFELKPNGEAVVLSINNIKHLE